MTTINMLGEIADPDTVQCFSGSDNFETTLRVIELADKLGLQIVK